MKFALLSIIAFSSISAFALCTSNGVEIHAGDGALVGSKYQKGARVQSVNHSARTVVLVSSNSGKSYTEACEDLYIAEKCVAYNPRICSGREVWIGAKYPEGAEIIAFHPEKKKVIVRSAATGKLHTENYADLGFENSCLDGICEKDVVNLTEYLTYSGFKVKAVNELKKTITIRDIKTGQLHEEQYSKFSVVNKYIPFHF